MALTLTNNSPSAGYISWTACNMQYKGVNYGIPAGNTNNVYVYWLASSPNAFQTANTIPTLGMDDAIVFLNKNGTAVNALTATIIDGDLIAPGSILSNAIAANTITGGNIAASTITGSNIAAATISASNIVANTISSNLIAANAIGTAALAAQAVTATQIASNTITAAQIASQTITANQIASNTITAAQIAANTITASQIAANTISANQIAANAIGTAALAAGAVTATQIASNTITANNINSLNGLNVGNGNFVIDSNGNVSLKGSIASGSTITGTTITGSSIQTPNNTSNPNGRTWIVLDQTALTFHVDGSVVGSGTDYGGELSYTGFWDSAASKSGANIKLYASYGTLLLDAYKNTITIDDSFGGQSLQINRTTNFAHDITVSGAFKSNVSFDISSAEKDIMFTGLPGGNFGVYANATGSGRLGFYDWGANKQVLFYDRQYNLIRFPDGLIVRDDHWNGIGFMNNWKQLSAYETTGYRKDAFGNVTVKLYVYGGTAGTTVFNLPAGYRPLSGNIFQGVDNSNSTAAIRVTTDGNVAVLSGNTAWIGLTFTFPTT